MLFTSESVTEGHPDKVADQISDAILDAYLEVDKYARVACEVLVTTGQVVIAGEITSITPIDVAAVVRKTIKKIGYVDSEIGFDYKSCGIMVNLDRQSPDISQGVTAGKGRFKEQGAGDQGMMFGYACRETPQLMPLPIMLAHKICKKLATQRKHHSTWLRPDGKAQVTAEYDDEGNIVKIPTIVVSTQHAPGPYNPRGVRDYIYETVIAPCLPHKWRMNKQEMEVLVNPTGKFVVGGPHGDCGLTGRKIIVDTYGGACPHGGGAFSGKDPSKVDRSAHYMARYIAKNIVAAGIVDRITVQLAYAIGVAEPVSISVGTDYSSDFTNDQIVELIYDCFDMTPAGIIKQFDLLRPIYAKTAAYGHFGRSEFPWEKVDKIDELKKSM